MLKFTIILYFLILTCIGPIFKLIILFLYSTSFSKIVTNRYKYSFFLYSIFSCFTILGVIWFLITLQSIIVLNYLLCYLTFKFKYLLIVSLRV